VTIISGPVEVQYPAAAEVVWVTTTDEMLEAARRLFPHCDGAIGVAAPCDYRPQRVESRKIAKTGEPLVLHLVETPDVIAELGQHKRPDQWVVAFALETDDHRFRALRKLEQKSCDLIVVNGASAIQAVDTSVEVINRMGEVLLATAGSKPEVAARILELLERQLIH
jgi:phosphopantothenoylcysteine decarboxylase/phosphopantothenate--cysteine ligase